MSEIGSVPPTPPAPTTGAGGQAASPQPATAPPASAPQPQAPPAQGQPPQNQSPQNQPQQGPAPAPPPAPQSGQGGQSGAGATPQPPVIPASSAAQISDALRALANGVPFSAQIVARDGASLLVRAASGTTLALSNLAAALEQANVGVLLNASVRLQLNPNNPQLATVTNANGIALQPALATTAQPPTAAQLVLASSPPPSAGAAPQPALPQPGQVLTAVVLPSPAPPSPSSPAAAPVLSTPAATALPPGSQLQVVVQTATPPAALASASTVSAPMPQPAPPAGLPVPPSTSATANPIQVAGTAPPAAAQPTTGNPGLAQTPAAVPSPASPMAQSSSSRPVAMPPPLPATSATAPLAQAPVTASSAIPMASSSPVGSVVAGVVTGQGRAGQVLVSTPQNLLSLNLPQPLPPGTQLVLEVTSLTRPAVASPTTTGAAPLGGVLTRLQGTWPALQQTFDVLRTIDPALGQRLQTDLLPQPNVRLASTALQFMAAAAIGNAQAWLGADAVRKLEQSGRSDLLRKLDEDFAELGRLNQRQGEHQWQALVMPMLIGGKVEPIQIFMRRRRDAGKKQQQTRFIIDFNLESTGPIQFDGFVSTKQLDLILRSETEFGPAFRLDVTAIFENALEVTGMTGTIAFRDREAPLAWPSPELEAQGPSTEIKA